MKKLKAIAALCLVSVSVCGQTLDECRAAAERHYPLISRYDLIRQTRDVTVENISKGWYPHITASAQGTLQNRVVELPDAMNQLMAAQGLDVKGLSKGQYRAGLDVTQLLYDGGRISAGKEVARRQSDVESRQTEVDIYQVHQRVNDLYFGILLTDARLSQNEAMTRLLLTNEKKLQSMYERGTASLYDLNAVKTERVKTEQQRAELEVQRRSLAALLSAFTGLETGTLVKPAATGEEEAATAARPELRYFDSQIALADAREQQLRAGRRPTVSAFASGYYGYPGYDMYYDMFHRHPTLNGTIGVRVSWDLGWIWTFRNDRRKLALQRSMAENGRATFLFNNSLELQQQTDEVEKYRRLMRYDEEILALRTQMRQAAESKLDHGIMAANDLVRDITGESEAQTALSLHEIQYLKALYDKKITR